MAKQKRKNKQLANTVMFLVLVGLAGGISFLVWNSYFKDNGKEVPAGGNVQIVEKDGKGGVEKKEETTEDKKEEEDKKPEEKAVQYDGADPNQKEQITGVITYAEKTGGKLVIRVNIDQYLMGGECELTLKQGDSIIYTETVGVVDAASTSTCEGFDVVLGDDVSGITNIYISINSDGKSGLISGGVEL